jgi:hypothetical protein
VEEMTDLLRYRWSGEPGGEAALCWGRFSRIASRNSLRLGRFRLLREWCCGTVSTSSSLELVAVSELVLRTGDGRLGVGRSCAKAVTGMGAREGDVGPLLLRWWFVGREWWVLEVELFRDGGGARGGCSFGVDGEVYPFARPA